MRQIYKTRNKGAALRKPVLIYGVLRCDFHESPHKKYWHRDENETRNIMKIYRRGDQSHLPAASGAKPFRVEGGRGALPERP